MSHRHGQGYSRFEHGVAWHGARTAAIRPGRRSDQDFAAEDHQPFGARSAVFPSPPMSNGCSGPRARATAPFIITEIDPQTGAHVRAEPLEQRIRRTASHSPIWPAARRRGPATAPSSSDATARSSGPLGLTQGAALSNRVGAGLDPCGALQTRVTLSAARLDRGCFFPGRGGEPGGSAIPDRQIPHRRPRRGLRRGHQRSGTTSPARSR